MKIFGKIDDILDLDVLQSIQDHFSGAVGLAFVTVDYKGNPVTRESGFTGFCSAARRDCRLASLCHQCDAHGGLHAAITDKPHIYKCHAGLVDFAVPLIAGGSYYGAMLGGQVRIEQDIEAELDKIVEKQSDWRKDPQLLEEYRRIPYLPFEKVEASVNLLHDMIHYVLEEQYRSHLTDQLHQKDIKLMEERAMRLDLEKSLQETEISALYHQINSDFFFNILNMIARMAFIEGAKKTEDLVYNFSDMMRYILDRKKGRIVTLSEEIEHVKKYLQIQKVRLEDRLNSHMDIPEIYNTVACPFMVLQPVVESSLKYAPEAPEVIKLAISCEEQGDDLILQFYDNGSSVSGDAAEDRMDDNYFQRGGCPRIGLSDVDRRLHSYFGKRYGLDVENVEGGTLVKMRLPLRSDIALG